MKKLVVKDILNLIEDEEKVACNFYAYGVFYASSMDDGMQTVADCKDNLNYDCINARVTSLSVAGAEPRTVIYAELVH